MVRRGGAAPRLVRRATLRDPDAVGRRTRRQRPDPHSGGPLPSTEPAPITGGVVQLLAALASARAETNRTLGNVAPAAMTRPTQWVHYDIDVRFRLHRFGAHIAEHTVQCEKTLAGLGGRVTEGRRIVRRLTAIPSVRSRASTGSRRCAGSRPGCWNAGHR